MRYRNIVLINAEPVKNFGNLKSYLIENTENFLAFHYSPGYSDKYSYMEKYVNGKLQLKREFSWYKGSNNFLKHLFYLLYVNFIVLRYSNSNSYVINLTNPIFCVFNSIHGLIKKTNFIYYIGDYYEGKGIMLKIYNLLVDYYERNSTFVLYESPPIEKVYRQRNNNTQSNAYRKLVTLGIKPSFVKTKSTKRSKKEITLGFIGIIREQQGLDLVFEFLRTSEQCKLEIIGKGYKYQHYKDLAKKLKIMNKVKFHGFVDDPKSLISRWDIGMALYENKMDNLSRYCEPTKIKDYLSHGLPVITTKTTYFYEEINHFHAGLVINENVESLSKAVKSIKKNYSDYIDGVNKIVNHYNYERWYQSKLKFLEKSIEQK